MRCAQLRRLALKDCELDGVPEGLAAIVPNALTVLRLQDDVSEAPCDFSSSLADLLPKLQCLKVVTGLRPDRFWAGAADVGAWCSVSSLLVLDLGLGCKEFGDADLLSVASTCHLLDTLKMHGSGVSASGIEVLVPRADGAALLPVLRVAAYTNDSYESHLSEYLTYSVEELVDEESSALAEVQPAAQAEPPQSELQGDSHFAQYYFPPSTYAADTAAFFAFLRLVRMRGLVAPLDAELEIRNWSQAHPLLCDYFALSAP